MGFTVRVFSLKADPFRVTIGTATARAEDVKDAIKRDPEGVDIGFVTSAKWLIFLADESGVRVGDALDYKHLFSPAEDADVNVWVEPKTPATAGEALHDDCGSPHRTRTANVARSSFRSAAFPPQSQRRSHRRCPDR